LFGDSNLYIGLAEKIEAHFEEKNAFLNFLLTIALK